jgi:hypothetical protein
MNFPDTAEIQLYVRSMGKLLKVTSAFETDEAANAHMATHRDEAVVAVIGNTIFLANIYDHGTHINTVGKAEVTK